MKKSINKVILFSAISILIVLAIASIFADKIQIGVTHY